MVCAVLRDKDRTLKCVILILVTQKINRIMTRLVGFLTIGVLRRKNHNDVLLENHPVIYTNMFCENWGKLWLFIQCGLVYTNVVLPLILLTKHEGFILQMFCQIYFHWSHFPSNIFNLSCPKFVNYIKK